MPRWSRVNFWFPAARRTLRAVRARRMFSRSIPTCAVALWGHAALVLGQFLSSPSCAVSWVGCTAYAVRGNFLSLRGSRSLWWRLGLPACGQFLLGGGDAGLPLRAPMSPHFCVQAGFDPPAKLACWGTLVSGVGLGPGLHFRPVPRVCPGRHCTPFGGLARHLKQKNIIDTDIQNRHPRNAPITKISGTQSSKSMTSHRKKTGTRT